MGAVDRRRQLAPTSSWPRTNRPGRGGPVRPGSVMKLAGYDVNRSESNQSMGMTAVVAPQPFVCELAALPAGCSAPHPLGGRSAGDGSRAAATSSSSSRWKARRPLLRARTATSRSAATGVRSGPARAPAAVRRAPARSQSASKPLSSRAGDGLGLAAEHRVTVLVDDRPVVEDVEQLVAAG